MKKLIAKLKLQTLSPIARAVKFDKLTYLSHSKLRSIHRRLNEINSKVVTGDIYEFGVALGGSSIILATGMGARKYRGYDVFGMIPAPTDNDERDTQERYDVIAAGTASGIGGDAYYGYDENLYDTVIGNFARHGLEVDGERIALKQGLFEDTVRLDPETKIALVHIDCDWFDPVLFCLEAAAVQLADGGIMIVDDYNDYEGCRKATDQFLQQNPNFQLQTTSPHAVITRKS